MRERLTRSCSLFPLLAALAAPAFAQETAPAAKPPVTADPTPAAAQPSSTEPPGGEIIVTARKRNERLLDVPVSVSALSGEQLQRYATTSLQSIAQQTPQLIISESQNQVGGSINLRGIGAGTANPSTEQTVTLNLDGVQVSYGNAIRLGQFDLQRVEVLKGPQALFFGKNSPGGIISLISNDPTDVFEAQVRAGYEFETQQRYVEGIVSGPVAEGLAARIVGYYSKSEGWYRNIGVPIAGVTPGPGAKSDNSDEKFVRGTLTYHTPDDAFSAKLKVNYGERDRDGVGPATLAQFYYCPTGASQLGNGITTDCKLDRNFTSVRLPASAAALNPLFGDGTPFARSRQFLGSLSLDYKPVETLTISSVTGYYRVHEQTFDTFGFVNIPAVAAASDIVNKSFSEELRLSSDFNGPFNFLAGAFYQDGDFSIINPLVITIPGGSPNLSPINAYYQSTRAYSFFAQARYKLTEQLEFSAGGRLSRERKRLTGTLNNTPIEVLNPSRNYKDFSPELTLTYKPKRDLTLYASYREGFTSGGFNTAPGTLRSPAFPGLPLRDISFDQMRARGGEVGFKGYALDRQLRFDLTGYYYQYKGLQLSRFDPVAIAQTTQNAGGAKVRGIEANAFITPSALPGFEARGGIAFNRANYTDFIGGCYGGQSVAAGCDLLPRNAALAPSTFGTAANPFTSQDQTGQEITRAPKWTVNAGLTYSTDLSRTVAASISTDAVYSASYYPQVEANPFSRQPGYWQLDASLSLYSPRDRKWHVALIGRNLTNRIVSVSTSSASLSGFGTGTANARSADLFGIVNSPRTILLQVTLKNGIFN